MKQKKKKCKTRTNIFIIKKSWNSQVTYTVIKCLLIHKFINYHYLKKTVKKHTYCLKTKYLHLK